MEKIALIMLKFIPKELQSASIQANQQFLHVAQWGKLPNLAGPFMPGFFANLGIHTPCIEHSHSSCIPPLKCFVSKKSSTFAELLRIRLAFAGHCII